MWSRLRGGHAAAIDQLARSRAVSRRDLLQSAAASAAVLAALSSCTSEERASQGGTAPGGTFAVPTSIDTTTSSTTTTIDPATSSSVLDVDDDLVVDVQLHFLDPTLNTGEFGAGFPQASCGLGTKECFAEDVFLDLIFGQSTTRVGVLSGLPIAGADSPFAVDVMDHARELLASRGGDQRLLLQAPVFPATGDLQAALDGMAADAAAHPVAAWKTYTHTPTDYRLDDDRGDALLSQAVALGTPILAVHKGVAGEAPPPRRPMWVRRRRLIPTPPSSCTTRAGKAAWSRARTTPPSRRTNSEVSTACWPASPLPGSGPAATCTPSSARTWFNLARSLDDAAHVLGKLLVHLGPERILWGTDSIWYGSPQGQIDAFRAFTITDEFQERFGYPAITDETKRLILGANAAGSTACSSLRPWCQPIWLWM